MRRGLLLVTLGGLSSCGPSVREPEGGADESTTRSSTSDPATSDEGVPPESETTRTGSSTTGRDDEDSSGVGETSTGSELPPDFIGSWLCEGWEQPIFLVVDTYEPMLPTGHACIPDGSADAPPAWTRCAELSPHPLDAPFWVRLDFGDELVIQGLFLLHDHEQDVLDGNLMPTSDDEIRCERYVDG